MAAAGRRYDAAATRVAAGPTVSVSTDAATDLVDATVLAPAAYGADAAMFRAADQARGTLLDVLA
jgi:hypothetical protein